MSALNAVHLTAKRCPQLMLEKTIAFHRFPQSIDCHICVTFDRKKGQKTEWWSDRVMAGRGPAAP
jgi:hypothetical protein